MKFRKSLVSSFAIASLMWASAVHAHEPRTVRIDLTIDGMLTPVSPELFLLDGDMFFSGGPLDGRFVGTYSDISIPTIDPNCDPVAAAVFGFNAADGTAVLTFKLRPNADFTLGTIVIDYHSCVVGISDTGALLVESEGEIVGGTGIFRDIQGGLCSSAMVVLPTGELHVDLTLELIVGGDDD